MNDINTKDIFAAFKRSGKKHILITGAKGSGKTTLARALAGEKCAGFESYALPRERVIIRNRLSGEEGIIGKYDDALGKMKCCPGGFDVGIKAIDDALCCDGAILLDEIGYLESDAPDFQRAVNELLDRKSVILTVRKDKTDFILSLTERDDVFVFDTDILRGGLGCVIMASGFSRRYGANKLLCDFGGKKLIERAIEATDGIFSKRVVVTRYEEIARICENSGVEYVLHSQPDRSDTVKLGLGKMTDTKGCMFMPCDQPLIKRKTVMDIAEGFLSDERIWRICSNGEVGMPVIFPRGLYGELMALKEGGGSSVIKKHPEMVSFFETDKNEELLDADTPEILRFLEKQYL